MPCSATGRTSGGNREIEGGDALGRVAQCIDKQHGFTVMLVKIKEHSRGIIQYKMFDPKIFISLTKGGRDLYRLL